MQTQTRNRSHSISRSTLLSALRRYLPIGTGVLAVMIALWATRTDGLELTTDSVTYLSTGENVASGNGFTTFEGERLVDFPPALPAVIAFLDIFSPNLDVAIRVFMALTLGATVTIASLWIRTYVENWLLIGVAHGMLIFAPVLLYTHSTLSTEPLFILISLCAIWLTGRVVNTPSWRSITILGILIALAILTRYVGVVLLPAMLIVFLSMRVTRRQQAQYAAGLATVALLPLAVWLGFNYAIAGSLFGDRGPSDIGFTSNLIAEIATLSQWLFSTRLAEPLRGVLMLVLFAPVFIGIVRLRGSELYERARLDGIPAMAAYVAIYLAYLAVLRSIVGFDALETRILSPIYVVTVLMSVWCFERLLKSSGTVSLVIARYAVALVIGISALTVARGLSATQTIANSGSDYTRQELAPFMDSAIVGDISATDLYSNDPWLVYLASRREVKLSPREHVYAARTAGVDDIEDLAAHIEAGGSPLLLWADLPKRGYVASFDALDEAFDLKLISEDAYWRLYSIHQDEGTSR